MRGDITKDDLTIEELIKYNGFCILGFECENCPMKDVCVSSSCEVIF